MMNAPAIGQDLHEFVEPGHIHRAQRGDHLVMNEVLFDVLRVVLTVVEGRRAQDDLGAQRPGAN
jgi:hypothetical protein